MVSFTEKKRQILNRQSKAKQLCKDHDLDIADFMFVTAHKFFDGRHKQQYKYYRGNLEHTETFRDTLRRFESSRDKEVMNIQQFDQYYRISYVDMIRLRDHIDEKQAQQKIEVKAQ